MGGCRSCPLASPRHESGYPEEAAATAIEVPAALNPPRLGGCAIIAELHPLLHVLRAVDPAFGLLKQPRGEENFLVLSGTATIPSS